MTDWEQRWKDGETPWDKGAAAPPLLEYLEAGGEELRRAGRILVPGCGSGHDVRALAAEGLAVTGVDLSPTAVAAARAWPRAGSEAYECGDFLDEAWRPERACGAIWEHTCFCAIDPADRPRYARAAARLLPEGGHLAGVFYLNPWDPGEEEQGPPFGATKEEIAGLFAPWFILRKECAPGRAYPGREGREWLAVFERNAVPERGVAEMPA